MNNKPDLMRLAQAVENHATTIPGIIHRKVRQISESAKAGDPVPGGIDKLSPADEAMERRRPKDRLKPGRNLSRSWIHSDWASLSRPPNSPSMKAFGWPVSCCSKRPDLINIAGYSEHRSLTLLATRQKGFMMAIRGRGHWNFPTGASWLWLICLVCVSGRCVGQTYDGFGYSVSGTNITIVAYSGPGGALTIPSSIPGVNGTVTSIGETAFCGCSGLTNITIGNGVTSIGEGAFSTCSNLTSVTIPDGVTSIGVEAFGWCSGLTNATIPASVTDIGAGAFGLCSRLTAFTVDTQNPSYTTLGGVLFDKNQTTLLQCPGGETGAYTIPSSVASIEDGAFGGCSGLTSVTIPASVTNIGEEAFAWCSGLTAFTVATQNPSYSTLGGVLFNKNQTTLAAWPPGEAGAYTIPGSVTSIGEFAFGWCSGLASITLPSSVTSVGDYAFNGCSGLTSAYFQGNAPSFLGASAFNDTAPGFSIYYPSSASGWSTPTWNGYPAQPYVPLLTLTRGSEAVTPSFNWLLLGTNYQLQVSTDLNTWSNTGQVFTATNASAAYAQPFNVANGSHLFFRLVSAP